MSLGALVAVLSLFPALSLWGAYPRRRWAAGAAGGGCLVLWVAGFLLLDPESLPAWTAAGVLGLAACVYAAHLVGRNSDEYERLESAQRQKSRRGAQLAAEVATIKSRIHRIDTEQREVLAIYGMIKGLSEALSWEDMRPKLEIAIRQYLQVEAFALYVTEEGGMAPVSRRGMGSSAGGNWATLERYLQERKAPPRVPHVLDGRERAVFVPIFEKEELVGCFYVPVAQGADAARLLDKAETFVEEVSFAFKRVRLFQEVERSSRTDGLTGLYRRGALDRKLAEEVVRGQTFKTTFCLMILDIDHFKSLNDRYGHPFGDQVLARVGEILRESFYDTDFVARYGGEEFAVLLPRAQMEGVRRKAEAVRGAVLAERFESAMEEIRVTVSIGIAQFPRDGETAEAVLRQADQALYYAKESGRNRSIDIADIRSDS